LKTLQIGIITRCAKAMFERLERNKDADFSVRVSCLEVYNEEMTDLLACENLPGSKKLGVEAKREKRPLRLVAQEGKESKGVVCANLDEPVCESMDECLDFLRRGAAARRVAATLCNDKSSRSHAIYTLKVCVRSLADDGRDLVVNGQLNLVDLAGSECVGRSGAKDVRAREAGNINQSLLTLGRVITALVTASGDSK
jgi:kinesin family protein 11